MRLLFILLLIANIAFGLMQWLKPYEQKIDDKARFEVSDELVLLSEVEIPETVPDPEVEVEVVAIDDSEAPASESPVNQQLCYTIGPFKDEARAQEISDRYSMRQISTRLKSSLEQDYLGTMVYVPGHKNRREAEKTAKSLDADGFHEHIIVDQPDQFNVVSVGVFGLKKNAEHLMQKLKALNYQVASESKYRERTIYWLYYQQPSELELPALLDTTDVSNGISQISRQCP
ncbi:MAG: SPOR domain-containing protein [Gammaproteobacteria bacterium]|nr:SPOR domain-containing protein [Gammaproteobacteria bacterium]